MAENMFVSNRDVIVTSTKGHSIRFEKGKPQYVPRSMHKEVIDRGILPADEDGKMDPTGLDAVIEEAERKPRVVLAPDTNEERADEIRRVLLAIAQRNNASDFTSGGVPSAASVSAALGWRVDAKEIRPVWNELKVELVNK